MNSAIFQSAVRPNLPLRRPTTNLGTVPRIITPPFGEKKSCLSPGGLTASAGTGDASKMDNGRKDNGPLAAEDPSKTWPEAGFPVVVKLCNYCSQQGNFRCTRCRKTCYCSVACQTEDWKAHRHVCKPSTQESPTSNKTQEPVTSPAVSGPKSPESMVSAVTMGQVNRMYLHELPKNRIAKGAQLQASVLELRNPGKLFIHIQTAEMMECLHNVTMALQKTYAGSLGTEYLPDYGELCAVKYSQDQNWYRGAVQSADAGYKTASIFYIDFGNEEVVTLDRIKPLSACVDPAPPCAVECRVAGVMAVTGSWTEECCIAARQLLAGKSLPVTVVDMPDNIDVWAVDIMLPAVGMKLSAFLLEQGYAVEESSGPGEPSDQDIDSILSAALENFRRSSGGRRDSMGILPPEPLTQGLGDSFSAMVTHVQSPSELICQKLENAGVIQEMQLKLREYCAPTVASEDFRPAPGSVCCSQFTEDHQWYRATVLGYSSETRVCVGYIDFGNSEEVDLSRLRPLNAELAALPMQAIPCVLADVKPVLDRWSDEAILLLKKSVCNKFVRVEIVGERQSAALVVLTDEHSDPQTSVNELLLSSGHALSDDTAPPRATSQALTNTTTPPQAIGQALTNTTTTLQTTSQALTNTTAPLRAIGQALTNTIAPPQAIGQALTNTTAPLRAIGQALTNTTAPPQAIGQALTNTTAPSRAMGQALTNTTAPPRAIGQALTNTTAPLRAIGQALTNTTTPLRAIGQALTNTTAPSWAIGQALTNTTAPPRAIGQALTNTTAPPRAIGQALTNTTNPLRAIGQALTNTTAPSWAIGQALTNTTSPSRAIGQALPNTTAPPRAIGQALTNTAAPLPSIGQALTNTTAPSWAIGQALTNTAAPLRAIGQALTNTTAPSWAIGQALPNTTAPPRAIGQALTNTAAPLPSIGQALTNTTTPPQATSNGPPGNSALLQAEMADKMEEPSTARPPTSTLEWSCAELPSDGQTVELVISVIENPGEFYCHRYCAKDIHALKDLSGQVLEHCQSQSTPFTPAVGEPCCAVFPGDASWYRAMVLGLAPDKVATVYFVDFGNTSEVEQTHMQAIPHQFLKLPFQAIRCWLAGVEPRQGGWGGDAASRFQVLSVGRQLQAQVCSITERGFGVELMTDGQNIAAQLVAEGLAAASGEQEPAAAAQGLPGGTFPVDWKTVELPRNKPFQPRVGAIVNPSLFYIMREDNKDMEKVPALMKDLAAQCSAPNQAPPSSPLPGAACCVQLPGGKSWYRAVVLQTAGCDVEVVCADYGNVEKVPLSNIVPIADQHLLLPFQIARCALSGRELFPAEWSESVLEMFSLQLRGAAHATVDGFDGTFNLLVLALTDFTSPSSVIKSSGTVPQSLPRETGATAKLSTMSKDPAPEEAAKTMTALKEAKAGPLSIETKSKERPQQDTKRAATDASLPNTDGKCCCNQLIQKIDQLEELIMLLMNQMGTSLPKC